MSTTAGVSRRAEGRSWVSTLFSYASRCKGRMALSVIASVASVAAGFVPFYAVYSLMEMAIVGSLTWGGALVWIAVAAAAYVMSKFFSGVHLLSTFRLIRSWNRFGRISRASSCAPPWGRSNRRASAASRASSSTESRTSSPLGAHDPRARRLARPRGGFGGMARGHRLGMALACLACVPLGLAVFASSLKEFNAKYAAFWPRATT